MKMSKTISKKIIFQVLSRLLSTVPNNSASINNYMQVLIKLLLILVHVLWYSILDGPQFRIRPKESP